MVMKRNAMFQNLRQSIRRSFGRYIAIVVIIALGAGLFLGLLMTKTDMVATGQKHMDELNMYDLRVISNYGWSKPYVEKIAQTPGVADAEGVIYMDLIARMDDSQEDKVYRFYSIPEKISRVELRGGRMPQADNECLADGFQAGELFLGKKVTVSQSNDEDSLDSLRTKTFTVVGYVASPLYMDLNRGTTSVGSGSLTNYFYIPEHAFDVDYYTEIDITLPERYPIYSARYQKAVDDAVDSLEPGFTALAEQRFQDVKDEAEKEYADGYQEFLDGMQEYRDGAEDAEKELRDAWQELRDGEQDLVDARKKLVDGGRQIEEGKKALNEKQEELNSAKAAFEAAKPGALAALDQAKADLDAKLAQVEPNLGDAQAAVDYLAPKIQTLIDGRDKLNGKIADLNAQLETTEDEGEKQAIQQELSAAQTQLGTYNTYISVFSEKMAQAQSVIDGYNQIQGGYQQLEAERAKLDAAEAQLKDGQRQIDEGRSQLDDAYSQLMVGWGLYHEGEQELADGWVEYEDGKKEAYQELADARQELLDAREELADARAELDDLEESQLYILDRKSNPGYNNLDSSAGIVAGVSRVMPVFFLLVASLVCITTMTRMIDEERTQIGTLKALGYSNGAIIGKYLAYSGTGAVIGCGLGVLAGSTVFPQILWNAYCILLYIQPNVVLRVDWPLCLGVVALYTAVMLFVTWYSCHRTLEEQPAELIRPKAPSAGKKILLEHLPIWKRIPFLEKVSIRNIFRYRQRLAMMLVGIGGCTALLLTGFGLRDSITNVVDYQFSEVALYDMSVYFREGLTEEEQTEFTREIASDTDNLMFYHQSSADLLFEDGMQSLYLISGGSQLQDFLKFHSGGQLLPMPGKDETLLTIGAAKALGVKVGDKVQLRNADMETLELTVSGIYDNHVYNYAIVAPETIESQWGRLPELQMAYLTAREDAEVHLLGAKISDMSNVMNIAVSEDLADMVGSMMKALDSVVWVIVFCAGLLAVTVLYNLTNININERIREIATIKVLGFNARETAAYVFKENMTLTVAGALLGLPLGMLLLTFVMSQIKIELVWFKALVEPISFLWSIALTLLSALAVNFIFYFKLQKINMAEALKSVE